MVMFIELIIYQKWNIMCLNPKELRGKVFIDFLKPLSWFENNYPLIDKKELNYFLLTTPKEFYHSYHDLDEELYKPLKLKGCLRGD